jgi:hypothetical protein
MEDIYRDILRDFRHTFNSHTKRPWTGVWSAQNFYEKYHLLIAVITDVHLGEICESNLDELYFISEKTYERVKRYINVQANLPKVAAEL